MSLPRTRTISGSTHYSCTDAAAVLATTGQTVRNLSQSGELVGTKVGRGAREFLYVTQASVDAFVERHGTFPAARSRVRDRAGRTLPSPTDQVESTAQERVAELEQVIRSQSIAITHLTLAAEAEARAGEHFESALAERRKAAEHLRGAVQEFAETLGQQGIPQNPTLLVQHSSRDVTDGR